MTDIPPPPCLNTATPGPSPAAADPIEVTLQPVVNALGEVLMRHRLCGTIRWLKVPVMPDRVTDEPMSAIDPNTGHAALCSYCGHAFLHADYWTITYQVGH